MTKSCAANIIGKSSWHWIWICRLGEHRKPWKQLAPILLSWFVWGIPLVDHHADTIFTHWSHQVRITLMLSAHLNLELPPGRRRQCHKDKSKDDPYSSWKWHPRIDDRDRSLTGGFTKHWDFRGYGDRSMVSEHGFVQKWGACFQHGLLIGNVLWLNLLNMKLLEDFGGILLLGKPT